MKIDLILSLVLSISQPIIVYSCCMLRVSSISTFLIESWLKTILRADRNVFTCSPKSNTDGTPSK